MGLRNKLLIVLIITLICNSCDERKETNESTSKNNEASTNSNVNKASDSSYADVLIKLRDNLKGALLKDTLTVIKLIYFSDSISPDSFILRIPPGLIAKTKSELIIKKHDSQEIYSESFDTYYFARYIFEPDSVPIEGGQDTYDNYMKSYIKSLTKIQFELYTKKAARSLFDDILVSREKLNKIMGWYGEVIDKELFDEVEKDTT